MLRWEALECPIEKAAVLGLPTVGTAGATHGPSHSLESANPSLYLTYSVGQRAVLLLNVANYHKQMNSCPVQRVRTGAWPFTVDWAPRCLFKTWQCVLMRIVMTGLDFRGICPLLVGNTHINIPIPFFSHTVWSVSESEQQLLNMKLNNNNNKISKEERKEHPWKQAEKVKSKRKIVEQFCLFGMN